MHIVTMIWAYDFSKIVELSKMHIICTVTDYFCKGRALGAIRLYTSIALFLFFKSRLVCTLVRANTVLLAISWYHLLFGANW